jgi:hypothetical protein
MGALVTGRKRVCTLDKQAGGKSTEKQLHEEESQVSLKRLKTEKHNTYQLYTYICIYIYIVYLLMMGYRFARNM